MTTPLPSPGRMASTCGLMRDQTRSFETDPFLSDSTETGVLSGLSHLNRSFVWFKAEMLELYALILYAGQYSGLNTKNRIFVRSKAWRDT